MSRLETLLQFHKEDPSDAFTLYAIAMEYEKTDIPQALIFYEILLSLHPDYTGTYFHAARLYASLNQREKAIAIYQKGLEITKRLGESKNFQELQGAYTNFLYEEN
ncbi:MAG: tetratricopeptide repeat protein [Verrucomicrobia bacterium]|nr:tetratricopeptide repeat protein [Cytophagales bacterium]